MSKIFVTLILLMASAIAGFFYLRPAWQEFRNLQDENESLSNISAELDTLIENRDALINTINTVSRENLQKIDRALPQGARSSELLVLLEVLANKHRVVLRRVDLASTQELKAGSQPRPGGAPILPQTRTIREFPVTFNITGSYENMRSFLADVEKNLRIIDVESISFSSPGRAADFDVNIKAKTYYQ